MKLNLKQREVTRAQCILSQKTKFDKHPAYLILRKCHIGLWGLTGGGIEKGENPKKAMLRELGEELHIAPKNISFGSKSNTLNTSNWKYGATDREITFFEAKYNTPFLPVNISIIDDPQYPHPEHFEFRWVSYKDEIKHLEFGSPDIKAMLEKLLA